MEPQFRQRLLRKLFSVGRSVPLLLMLTSAALSMLPGCCDAADFLRIRGNVVDADSAEGVSGAALAGRSLTAGEVTAVGDSPPSAGDGQFALFLWTGLGPCIPAPVIPAPEQFEVFVVRDGCENRFVIDVSDETTTRVEAPGESFPTYELLDPIRVPPCEGSEADDSLAADQQDP